MSYNLYGWNALVQNPWKAENVYKAIRQVMHRVNGVSSCDWNLRRKMLKWCLIHIAGNIA